MTRTATPGLTPVHELLGHEERLTRLERENTELRQMAGQQALVLTVLVNGIDDLRRCIQIGAKIDSSHHARLERMETAKAPNVADIVAGIGELTSRVMRLEGWQQGDLRLSEHFGGFEQRLGLVEQGVCR